MYSLETLKRVVDETPGGAEKGVTYIVTLLRADLAPYVKQRKRDAEIANYVEEPAPMPNHMVPKPRVEFKRAPLFNVKKSE